MPEGAYQLAAAAKRPLHRFLQLHLRIMITDYKTFDDLQIKQKIHIKTNCNISKPENVENFVPKARAGCFETRPAV